MHHGINFTEAGSRVVPGPAANGDDFFQLRRLGGALPVRMSGFLETGNTGFQRAHTHTRQQPGGFRGVRPHAVAFERRQVPGDDWPEPLRTEHAAHLPEFFERCSHGGTVSGFGSAFAGWAEGIAHLFPPKGPNDGFAVEAAIGCQFIENFGFGLFVYPEVTLQGGAQKFLFGTHHHRLTMVTVITV